MLFNSSEFLFVFLPIVLVGYLFFQRYASTRVVMAWLCLSSLFFYGWWNPVYLLLLALSATVNYSLGLLLSRAAEDVGKGAGEGKGERRGRALLALGVLFNLGLLAWFKYANWLVDSLNAGLELGFNLEHIILPLAISFYTFQQITYLVDTRRGLTAPHGILEYCLFVSFFPQLIAGPIVHHSEMLAQFERLGERRDHLRNISIGVSMLVIGLFKKVVIADGLARFATPVFTLAAAGGDLNSLDIAAGIFSYAFQLYFDFSGYSDMAIGLACLFGIRLPVNFFSPYRAQNISDFWRMWHATLSRFLRDYVYNGLGGFLCSPNRQRFNLFVTMFAGGVWHGAGWTFVLYGFCHGVYVVVHQLWRIKVSGPLGLVARPWYRAFSQVFTFLLVALTLGLFRADSVTTAQRLYSGLLEFSGNSFSAGYLQKLNASGLFRLDALVTPSLNGHFWVFGVLLAALAICWLLPSTYQLFKPYEVAIDKPVAGRPPVVSLTWRASTAWSVYIALLAAMALANLSEVSEFLYFQF